MPRPELTDRAFRRFEPYIQSAVLNHPQPCDIFWKDTGLSPTTLVSRLRDALRSMKMSHWPCGWYQPSQHASIIASLEVRYHDHDPLRIVLGPPASTSAALGMPQSGLVPSFDKTTAADGHVSGKAQALLEADMMMWTDLWARDVIESYARLASQGVQNLPKLRIKKDEREGMKILVEELLTEVSGDYNVAYIDNGDHWLLF